jgi:8-oxo-dGTP pyrophosphatase MutT (NUDIX family)
MAQATPIKIAAAIVLDRNGRLLLVRKRGTRAFMQPGGKIEPDELPVNALVRELREELGMVIDPGDPVYLGRFAAPAANEPGALVVAELFELTIEAEPMPAAEIEEVIWVAAGRRKGIVLAPLTRDVVLPYCRL